MVKRKWPDEPYKGLEYYDTEDEPLFAGRDGDIDNCMTVITEPQTRILLLHGRSGVGKSSFLRAGLIPALERSEFSFIFLRDAKTDRPLFIRCTAQPIARIAEAVFQFTQVPRKVKNAESSEGKVIDLSAVRLGCDDLVAFVQMCEKPEVLVDVLEDIARRLSHTLIVVVDQAEEAVTLSRSEPRGLFQFLKQLSRTGGNVKLLVSLRTENFGEFFRFLNFRASIFTDVAQVLLGKLSRAALKNVILLPTSKSMESDLPQPPFDKYQFEFVPKGDEDGGAVEEMLDDLYRLDPEGGFLPPMQLACRNMYHELPNPPEPRKITRQQYIDGGRVQGRIHKHISQSLRRATQETCAGDNTDLDEQEQNWRRALSGMTLPSSDGTVRTNLVSEAELLSLLHDQGITNGIESALDLLTRSENLVLRRFQELRRDGRDAAMYSLAHDALALSLEQWRIEDMAKVEEKKRRLEAEQMLDALEKQKRARTFATGAITTVALLFAIAGWIIHGSRPSIIIKRHAPLTA